MNTNTVAEIASQIWKARFTENNAADLEIWKARFTENNATDLEMMNGVVSHARYSGRLEELEIILNHWLVSAMGDYCNRNNGLTGKQAPSAK